MVRVRRFLEISVLEAARQRIEHSHEIFDNLVYMFSGGKDSQAMLHLAKEYHEANNLGPVRAAFRDEEFIPQSAIDTVLWYHKQPWLNLRWLCIQQPQGIGIFDESREVTAWDPNREWFRQPPDFAEFPELDVSARDLPRAKKQAMRDRFLAEGLRGRIGFVMGVRAVESLARYRSVVNGLTSENYINASDNKDIKLVKPIYDWLEKDVLKYLMECGVAPSGWYTSAVLTGSLLRLAVPFSTHAGAQIPKLPQMAPEVYAKGLELDPDIAMVARWEPEYDNHIKLGQYEAEGWEGCRRYAREHFHTGLLQKCLQFIHETEVLARRSPEAYTVRQTLRKVYTGVSHMTSPLIAPTSTRVRKRKRRSRRKI